MKKTFLVQGLLGAFVLTGMLVFASVTEQKPSLKVGEAAPEFTVRDLDQKAVKLEDAKGYLLLVNFWATWCPHCVDEIPHLQKVYEKYADKGLKIYSVSNEDSRDLKEFMKDEDKAMDWHVLRDPSGDAIRTYNVSSIPALYLIGPDGKMLAKGNKLRGDSLDETLEEHIDLVPEETLEKIKKAKEKEETTT